MEKANKCCIEHCDMLKKFEEVIKFMSLKNTEVRFNPDGCNILVKIDDKGDITYEYNTL